MDDPSTKLWLSATPSLATACSSYSASHSTALPALFNPLRARIAADPRTKDNIQYLIPEHEAQMLFLLAKLINAKRVLEIGSFAGYSALLFATAGCSVTTLEISPVFGDVAMENAKAAGLEDKVKVVLGPAVDSLATVDGAFDLVFIDADKPNYMAYYIIVRERNLCKPGGLIIADNVLRRGLVAASEGPFVGDEKLEKEAVIMQAFNRLVVEDKGVECCMLPLFDGVTLIRVKE